MEDQKLAFKPLNLTLNHHPVVNGCHNNRALDVKTTCNSRFIKANSVEDSKYDTSSTVTLVMSENNISQRKRNLKKSVTYWLILLIMALIIIIMSSLYVTELKKDRMLQQTVTITNNLNNEPCFERAQYIKLPSIHGEHEVIQAINESSRKVINLFLAKNYKALSLSVTYMGETIWNVSYGGLNFTNPNSKRVTCDTPYPIASISKVFTVLALYKMEELGIIKDIDDEVQKYDSRFRIDNPFNKENITFRQLACMMSGLRRESPCYPPGSNNLCPYNTSTMLKRLTHVQLVTSPDSTPHYSNLGISLLGGILETRMKNETFSTWITKHILNPLKMFDTGFEPLKRKNDIPITNLADNITDIAKVVNWGWSTPAGGMYSTVNDLGKLSSYLLGKPNKAYVLKRNHLRKLFKPEYIYSDSFAQGCPFEVGYFDPYREQQKRVGYISYSKDGAIFGYGSMMAMIPEIKLGFNILVAEPAGSSADTFHTVAPVFIKAFDQLLKRKGKQYTLPPNPSYYVGSYKLVTDWPLVKTPCTVTLEDGILYLKIVWFKAPLTFSTDTTLLTGSFGKFNKHCPFLGIGLLKEKVIFDLGDKQAPGFHMNGIATYGYIQFKRIT